MNDDWVEVFSFHHWNSDGTVTTKSIRGDAVNLNQLAEAFYGFIQSAGYGYVTGVAIETDSGEFGTDA